MTPILSDRAALLDTVTLAQGSHAPGSGAMCVMEAAAYIAGEGWSDHPQCVSPVIAAFCRNWNDCLDEPPRTQLLRPLLPLVIGTRTTDDDENTRAWMATDWLVRVQVPAWMDLTPALHAHAASLRALPPLTSAETATACLSVMEAACRAASNAAESAARRAAYSAAESALAPTVTALQSSAQDLVRAMCAVGRTETPPLSDTKTELADSMQALVGGMAAAHPAARVTNAIDAHCEAVARRVVGEMTRSVAAPTHGMESLPITIIEALNAHAGKWIRNDPNTTLHEDAVAAINALAQRAIDAERECVILRSDVASRRALLQRTGDDKRALRIELEQWRAELDALKSAQPRVIGACVMKFGLDAAEVPRGE